MNKHYSFIVAHGFSLANETDADPMSDYSPGYWGISSQARAIKYAKELLAGGNTIKVNTYGDANYAALGNKMIKELGLSQPLFTEPEALKAEAVTNGKPSNLSQLKKYLQVGVKVTSKAIFKDGAWQNSRETFVNSVQGNAVTFEKAGGKSWVYFYKANEWTFDNAGATHHYIEREGKFIPSIRIEYL